MWPWGHLAFGFLTYLGGLRATGRTDVDRTSLLALAIGTQLPDLVDKPLVWWFDAVPSGRSVAHSVFSLAALAVVLYWSSLVDRETATAFVFGYATHIVGDVLFPLAEGDLYHASFFLYPAIPAVDYGPEPGLAAQLRTLDPSPLMAAQVVLFLAAVVVWWLLGRPGLDHLTPPEE